MDFDPKLIGNRVKYYRGRLGLSQKELASRIGVAQSYIAELENGRSKYKQLNTLLKLADFFHVTLDDLFFDNLEKYKEIAFDDDEKVTDILKDLSLLSVPKLKCIYNISDEFMKLKEKN